jgi:uncharacterized membrane protein (UPF0127 family)
MRFLRVTAALIVALVAACSDSGGDAALTTTTSTTIVPITTTAAPPQTAAVTTTTMTAVPTEAQLPEQLAGMELISISVDGASLTVAVADTPALRGTGLMFVEDLEDLDGMLFVFERDTSGGFWMKNTLLPLDIAFFDVDGRFVDGFVMEPCTTEECPAYFPEGSYRYALEMEEGTMPDDPQELMLPGAWTEEGS